MSSEAARRNARNRAAGRRWQRTLLDGLRGHGFTVDRLALAGAEDEGDHVVRSPGIVIPPFIVIEAKAGKLYPAEFVNQANAEADNYAEHRNIDRRDVLAVAVVKRRMSNWKDAYVITTVRELFRLE